MDLVVDESHRNTAQKLRQLLSAFETKRDLIALGAYHKGSDKSTDEAIAKIDRIETFLKQRRDEPSSFAQTRKALEDAVK